MCTKAAAAALDAGDVEGARQLLRDAVNAREARQRLLTKRSAS